MVKIGVVVFADTESHADLGRAFNALETVKESREHNDNIKFIFDGAGTKWLTKFTDENHDAHLLYQHVKDELTGACEFCADAFGVKEELAEMGIPLLDEFEKHPSLRSLAAEGYQIITF
jgi:hypothetical protein